MYTKSSIILYCPASMYIEHSFLYNRVYPNQFLLINTNMVCDSSVTRPQGYLHKRLFMANLTEPANGTRALSQLHVIVFWPFGIKADGDRFPDVLLWRELKMGAAKGERLPGLRV
jgi:hypothetical protein